ncbi:MAG: hypothetical protein MUF72_19405 [Elainella sp. Prado103]|jgi:hypothetical protein|nr:hypothetical protein [Elainella sp. Prado103]
MEVIHDQVSALNVKVDALYQMIEQLGLQTAEMMSVLKRSSGEHSLSSTVEHLSEHFTGRSSYHAYQSRYLLEQEMDHKDILSDTTYPETESHGNDRVLTPEVQIQRLTAQLTAAYNRIAALEEQLIAKRFS